MTERFYSTWSEMPLPILRNADITPGEKLVLSRLLLYAGKNRRAWPRVETLGLEVGLGIRQTRRCLQALEKRGLIRRQRSQGGRHLSSDVELVDGPLWKDEPLKPGQKSPGNASKPGQERPQKPGHRRPPEKTHVEKKKKDTDLDYLACESQKNCDSQPDSQFVCCATHSQHPQLREALADYMTLPGETRLHPSDRQVVDVMHAAAGATEAEVIACLAYLYDKRGLRPGTKHGPRHFAWFKTVVADYFRRERDQTYPPAAPYPDGTVAGLSKERFDSMTSAIGEAA